METQKTKRSIESYNNGGSSISRSYSKCPLFLGDTVMGKKVLEIFEGIPFSIFITIVTIITLFSDDFRKIFFTVHSDEEFSILTLICMSIYTIEILTLSILKEGYFLRFYFWLDLISTLTMILDLHWINNLMSGTSGLQTTTSIVRIARASRVSKIGARSMKLIRLLRLIRVLKLYKNASKQLQKENEKEGRIDSDNRTKLGLKSEESVIHVDNVKENKKRESANLSTQSKHQVSLKNITFEGANRRESVLHPSQKLSKKLISNKNIENQENEQDVVNELPVSPVVPNNQAKNPRRISKMKINKFMSFNQRIGDEIPQLGVLQPVNKNIQLNRNIGSINEQINNNFNSTGGNFISTNNNFNSTGNNFPTLGSENQKRLSVQEFASGRNSSHFDIPQEMKVSIRLKEEIQKGLITMILLILISIPVLNVDTWFDNTTLYEKSVVELEFFANKGSKVYEAHINNIISELRNTKNSLVYFKAPVNETCCEFPKNYPEYEDDTEKVENLRGDELLFMVSNNLETILIFDERKVEILSAQLNIGLTIFVSILLLLMVVVFIHDVEKEALEPLENMIDTVQKISENPLQAITELEKQNLIKESLQKGNLTEDIKTEEDLLEFLKEDKKKKLTEPVILENLIIKIGALLAVGFGEAGTELIAKNIENYGSLNVMMPGKKVICIFGFCDIRNFTDATEVLQAKVMVFVNEIAEICHNTVNKVGGNPNKNIGDAFLLVWKFKEEDTISVSNRHESSLELQSSLKVRQTADLSIFSFLKMIAQISKSENLQKYKNNHKLKKRIKNYEGVKMGFGLHVGWAIEGPIGSEFKIDASYLGANVNMAGRLEAATKHYGVALLISGEVYELMTMKNREKLRHIDKVEVKQGEKPMDLYTVDISVKNLLKKCGINPKKILTTLEKKKEKVHNNLTRSKLMNAIQKRRVTNMLWNEDKDVRALCECFKGDFRKEWDKGFKAYLEGDWKLAEEILQKLNSESVEGFDGPSQVILANMKSMDFEVPEKWTGVTPFIG